MVLDHAAERLLFRDAAAAHSFTDEPVTDDDIRAIWELAQWAPTATNQQPLRFVTVRSEAAKRDLVAAMFEENARQVAAAPVSLVLLADNGFAEFVPELWPTFPAAGDVFFPTPEAKADSARFNGALQMGYLTLAIRAKGFAAGPMTGFDVEKVQARFGNDRHRVLAVMAIGRPAADAYHPRLPRLDYDRIASVA